MSYADTLSEHRRLAILKFLAERPDYTSNASILGDVLDAVGVSSTRAQIITEIAWLHEQGLVERSMRGDVVLATISGRGVEVAQGKAACPGVKRPRPRSGG